MKPNQLTPVIVEVRGKTDKGRARPRNEDQFLIANLNKSMMVEQTSLQLDDQTQLHGIFQGTLLLVADGMGGHRAGDVASRLAIETVTSYALNTMPWFFRLDEQNEDDLVAVLGEALVRCEQAIRRNQEGSSPKKMGTTVTMIYVLWPNAYLVHAGDSRAYLLRDGRLRQMSRDHTMAQRIAEQTGVDEDALEGGKWSHALINAVGASGDPVEPDVTKIPLLHGDTLLLCSDGLSGMVDDARIESILLMTPNADHACSALINAANESGGTDNITAVVARFHEGTEFSSDETVALDSSSR